MSSPTINSWEIVHVTESPNKASNELQEEEKEEMGLTGGLLPGEYVELPGIDATLDFPQFRLKVDGTLYFTNYQFSFNYKNEDQKNTNEFTCVPYLCVCSITSPENNRYGYQYWNDTTISVTELEIRTKDMRLFRYTFSDIKTRNIVVTQIEKRAFWKKLNNNPNSQYIEKNLFAFDYFKAIMSFGDGGGYGGYGCVGDYVGLDCFYNGEMEFQRQNLNSICVLSTLNSKYQLCPSYPKYLIFPKDFPEDLLRESAEFRSAQRLPTICWVHPVNRATISRASQPLTGLSGHGSPGDEQLVQSLYQFCVNKTTTLQPSPPTQNTQPTRSTTPNRDYSRSTITLGDSNEIENDISLYIIDARSKLAAKCNWAKGGGYEREDRYQGCSLRFMDIHNIHQMRKSFRTLTKLCQAPVTPDRGLFEQTGWLNHVKMVLEAGKHLAHYVDKGKCILVHCSDGWDRTSQIVALTELLLDPYYRTLKGFGILIQKEWLAFGHRFEDRLGHGEPEDFTSEQSPIFIQFMDAVYQLLCQYPNWFEFNEEYLVTLLDHLYSGRFGTFLMDSEKEREELSSKTASIWPWLLSPDRASIFKNPEYCLYKGTIDPNCATTHLHVWTGYYVRYKVSMKQYHEHNQQTLERKKSRTELRHENQKLKEKIEKDAEKILANEKMLAAYEQLIKEHIMEESTFREALKEIEKAKEGGTENQDSLELIVEPKMENDGKVTFRVKTHKNLSCSPPHVTNRVGNLDDIVISDYDPQNTDQRLDCSLNEFLSQAVTIPSQQKNSPTQENNHKLCTATNKATQAGFIGRCAQQAHVLLPYGSSFIVSWGKVVDWLKSSR